MFHASLRGNKVHFTSLGCPRNLVDTEVMLGILLKAGFEATHDESSADYLVINTCGFLEASRQESIDTINELLNRKKPSAKLVVTGCMVQNHREEIKAKIPEVNYILGSGDVNHILELIQNEENKEIVTTSRSYLEAGEIPRMISTPKHYAYLKIAEGCRKKCAFCIIPKIKGPLKSKTSAQIIKEFHTLLNQGVHEIILIAQDLGDYGKDHDQKEGLSTLLKELLSSTKKDFWLRLLYLYPDEITDELISIIKSDKRILPYLDMPIQHINDAILASMKRKTSKSDIITTIQKLRQEVPDIAIRTSLMVGFPGETEEQFQELKRFIQEFPLDHIGIFKFSAEKGAIASSFEDQISEDVKEKRYLELMKAQEKIIAKRNKKWIGKQIPVLLDGLHPESDLLLVGRTMYQCPEIDGQVIINDGRRAKAFGKLHLVEITGIAGYDFIGTVIQPLFQERPEKKSHLSRLNVVNELIEI